MGLDTTSTFSKQLTQTGCHLRLFIKNFKESKNMWGFKFFQIFLYLKTIEQSKIKKNLREETLTNIKFFKTSKN